MILNSQSKAILCAATALSLAACGGANEAELADEAATALEATDVAEPATTEEAAPSSQAAAPADIIRGPGGLEEKCLARVNQETGGNAIGTNRISESEAAIEIYVNVDGATAPWKCLGWKDGTIAEVMFTGSEGEL